MTEIWTPDSGLALPSDSADGKQLGLTDSARVFADGRIVVDPESDIAIADGDLLNITPTQRSILSVLSERPDRLVSREELCDQVWGYEDYYQISNSLFVMLGQLRNKLGVELGDRHDGAIRNRKGLGYVAVSSLDNRTTYTRNDEDPIYKIADDRIEVNEQQMVVVADGEVVEDLSSYEARLLTYLAKRPHRIHSPSILATSNPQGYGHKSSQGAMVTVSTLRKKLGPELGHTKKGAIRTRTGVGYFAVNAL